MQSLDVISVNLWSILISLANLVILYLLLKKFLYKPVRKFVENREKAVQEKLTSAQRAEENAKADEAAWNQRMMEAKVTADTMISDAARKASERGAQLVAEANAKAESIVEQAKADAAQEKKKAEAEIRQQIVDISSLMTERILEREINPGDHKGLIDTMIDQIGAGNEGDQ